jgi:hypothetical protein
MALTFAPAVRCTVTRAAAARSLASRPQPCAALGARARATPRAGAGYRLYTVAELGEPTPKAEAAEPAAPTVMPVAAAPPAAFAAAAAPAPVAAPSRDAGFLGAAQELMNGCVLRCVAVVPASQLCVAVVPLRFPGSRCATTTQC